MEVMLSEQANPQPQSFPIKKKKDKAPSYLHCAPACFAFPVHASRRPATSATHHHPGQAAARISLEYVDTKQLWPWAVLKGINRHILGKGIMV